MYIEFAVPDMPDFPDGFPSYWLKAILVGAVSQNFEVNALASTYVRLVEAALVEYRLGASKLREFWNTHTSFNHSAISRSISHFESCLSDMYRAINCYRRLRRHKDQDPLCLMLNKERPSFATDPVADQLRRMRHEIHHLEEIVMNGQLQQGQPITLMPDGPEEPHPTEPKQTIKTIDRLVIGQRELLFTSLAGWLTEMGRFAFKIAEFAPDKRLRGA
jgi:hypothetical protein